MIAEFRGKLSGVLSGYDVVRLGLAFLLLTAAALKGYQLATEPVRGTSLLESRWFLILVVEFELLFGLWLLGNFHPRETRWFAVACFAAFAAISCQKALSGAASCGCFGRVHVNPWITFSLDLSAVLGLIACAPRPCLGQRLRRHSLRFRHGRRRLTMAVATWLLAGIPAAWAMAGPRIGSVGASGLIDPKAKIVVLEPEKWIGKPFPLLEYIDVGEQLRQGDWLVVLYHQDCPACRKLFARSADLAATLEREARTLAFVEIPRHQETDALALKAPYTRGRLTDGVDWFAETPMGIAVKEGFVVGVQTREKFTSLPGAKAAPDSKHATADAVSVVTGASSAANLFYGARTGRFSGAGTAGQRCWKFHRVPVPAREFRALADECGWLPRRLDEWVEGFVKTPLWIVLQRGILVGASYPSIRAGRESRNAAPTPIGFAHVSVTSDGSTCRTIESLQLLPRTGCLYPMCAASQGVERS